MKCTVIVVVALAALAQTLTAQVPCPNRCRSCENNVAECSKRSLTAPPRTYPQGTISINLEGNHIRVIAERTFSNLDSVDVLKISNNKIVALRNDAFSPFPNLTTLDLMGNRISRIYRRAFKDLSQLRTLSLNQNLIDTMEGIFQYVPNVYQLNIANNRITTINQHDLSPMSQIHYLDIRNNLISSIHSQAFKNLLNLRYLFLNGNPLIDTPRFEFDSQVLQFVDFSNCRLRNVPGPFPPSVTDLRMGFNQIVQVNSTAFTNITNIRLLAMNNNELHFVADDALSHLTQLSEVWLRNNKLVYIPRGIPTNVRRVYMDTNNIQQIEAGIFSNMSHLDYLTVESNQINRIQPNTFRGLRFLNTLNFQVNYIHTLEPDTFADLGSLSTLLLSNNPLTKIEAGAFRNLGNLSQLFLSNILEENFQLNGNFLPEMLRLRILHLSNSPSLVDDFMNMINNSAVFTPRLDHLQQLDLSYNNLKWVSPRIREVFPNLLSIPLDGNPLKCSRNLKWLRDWMVSSEVSFHNTIEIVCYTPLRLKDRTVRSIEDNEWADDSEVSSESVAVVTGNHRQNVSDNGGQALRDTGVQTVVETSLAPNRDRQGIGKRSKDGQEQRKGKKAKGEKAKKDGKKNKKGKKKKDKKMKKGKQNKQQEVENKKVENKKV